MGEQRKRRKTETDAVLPHFIDIRTEAHLRFNRLMRVRAAYKQALQFLAERGHPCFHSSSRLTMVATLSAGYLRENASAIDCGTVGASSSPVATDTVTRPFVTPEPGAVRLLTNGTVHSWNTWALSASWMMQRWQGCGSRTW
jgi:hypothetical protein